MKFSAGAIAESLGGRLVCGLPTQWIEAVSIDSRTVEAGDLFFAIQGPNHDGHRFVTDAIHSGAIGVVVSQDVTLDASVICIRVGDTTKALQDMASLVRKSSELKVVAITGSMGKTTTKEAAAAAIGSRFRVLKNQGNLNNLYGLPLSLLEWKDEDVAVLEMGMSEPGEIRRLTEIATPDVGVLTNVAAVHLEFFPSVAAIARAKGELMETLPKGAIAVVNADDPLVLEQARRFSGRQIRFGFDERADLRGREFEGLENGARFVVEEGSVRVEVRSPLYGRHNAYNLLSGLAAARAVDIDLHDATKGLNQLELLSHRGQRHRHRSGAILIDDTYNANPAAGEAALAMMGEVSASRRVAVLGDMLELGVESESMHAALGASAADHAVDLLVAIGEFGEAILRGARENGLAPDALYLAVDSDAVAEFLGPELTQGDVVLFKASRGVALERAIRRLLSDSESGPVR